MTDSMIAGVASETGLAIVELPRPAVGPGQLLVKVAAAGMNRADLNAARGAGVASRDSLGRPIGMEWAGTVEAIGPGVRGFAAGDPVACSGTGGYAEYAIADAGRCFRLPPGSDPVKAAILPLALMTAHNALVTEGRFAPGQSVLVHGASSAVGIATMRIARLLGASTIIGTSTREDRRERLRAEGADVAIDPTGTWSTAILDATNGAGADVVVDMVTGANLNETMWATALHGHIVNVGRLGGQRADLDLGLHALRRLNLVGVTFRTRTAQEIAAILKAALDDIGDHIATGRFALPLDRTFPLAQAAEAHAHMAANRHFGKIALLP